MARGDQIYVMREFLGLDGVYEHHGIDCGDGTVIHYRKTDDAEVARTSLASFASGRRIFIKHHPVSYIPDVVVQRAESRLGERQYNLTSNNCEHFANWCKTGRNESAQLARFGIDVGKVSTYGYRRLITEAAHSEAPADSLELLRHSLNNIAIAQSSIQPQYEQAQKELNTWHRVAQRALQQGREDLARAALHRKVNFKKTADQFKAQLDQLAALQESLEHQNILLQQKILSNHLQPR